MAISTRIKVAAKDQIRMASVAGNYVCSFFFKMKIRDDDDHENFDADWMAFSAFRNLTAKDAKGAKEAKSYR